jgi:hypothetical protein
LKGTYDAANTVGRGVKKSVQTLYEGGISTLPTAILQIPMSGFEAITKFALGIRNTISGEPLEQDKQKFKDQNHNLTDSIMVGPEDLNKRNSSDKDEEQDDF